MKLAIKGGDKIRKKAFLKWPMFDQCEEKGLLEVLESRKWFSGFLGGDPGSKVAQFETKFAQYQGTKYAIAVSSGAAALEIALASLGIGAGDEVIVPAYTFIATATAVMKVNAVPIIVDIEPNYLCIDPEAIIKAITFHTKAVIPVHYGGQIADMKRLIEIAAENNLIVIEDAAHAHGSIWNGKKAGTFGKAGCFSFQESKTITAGEGGIILTDDDGLAREARSYRSNGREEDRPGYEHHRLGWNYRLTEFQAAILLAQLQRLEDQVRTRTKNANYLSQELRKIPGFKPITDPPGTELNGHYLYSVIYEKQELEGVKRDKVIEALRAEGIPCQGGNLPINRSPMFKKENWEKAGMSFYSRFLERQFDVSKIKTPIADETFEKIIQFSQHLLLGDKEDIDDIVKACQKVSENASELRFSTPTFF